MDLPMNNAPHLLPGATETLRSWARELRQTSASPFAAARGLATRLGAHVRDGQAEIGFWAPELVEQGIDPERIFLEILTPQKEIDFAAGRQPARFRRQLVRPAQDGEFVWAVVGGMRPGRREQAGCFYRLTYEDARGQWHFIYDPLAYSVPFGAFAPAELYDLPHLQATRPDRAYFAALDTRPDEDGVPRITDPLNILQLHVNYASPEGTLAGLTRIYERIAGKQEAGDELTPAEQNYVGYDAVQLMPIEPAIEYEAGPRFWQPVAGAAGENEVELTVTLRRPDMTNWGYDVLIAASPAVNPAVLDSGRPEEFVDFLATLHNFPGKPIKVVLDVVYGHADNQALPLLNHHFFAGANMYGQNLNYGHPVVRAILLEMQRRKSNFGVDGVRVDGAQDFKTWDPETEELSHDDGYLGLMNDVVQEVAGQRYRPWMIFEDGRPWPQDDWELTSTYLEVNRQFPNVVQWGPLTFAHNTPFLFTFWVGKWWRIQEIARKGRHWITGCANHDTLRRGTQVDPLARVNSRLGNTLPHIFRKGYDNPAAKLFDYAMMPGIPMDFINASMRAPWSFIRNTDDRYGVKVVAEEARFLDWALSDDRYRQPQRFRRLKDYGFADLEELRRFMKTLAHLVEVTGYDLAEIARLLATVQPPLAAAPLSVTRLKEIAVAWMDDVHEYCNVADYMDQVNPIQAQFNLDVRQFRRQRRWLLHNLGSEDLFDYLRPVNGTVLFYGVRHGPDGERLLFVANMEGAPRTITPAELPIPELPPDRWQLALASPGLEVGGAGQELTLHDSQGALFTRPA